MYKLKHRNRLYMKTKETFTFYKQPYLITKKNVHKNVPLSKFQQRAISPVLALPK